MIVAILSAGQLVYAGPIPSQEMMFLTPNNNCVVQLWNNGKREICWTVRTSGIPSTIPKMLKHLENRQKIQEGDIM